MKTATVKAAQALIKNVIANNLNVCPMIWGPPGIGKSSIVQQTAQELGLGFIDLRISQLAPTDLRGVPFVDKETKTAYFARPDFFPTEGQGILFLDEINMASPVMMGLCQQLLLDRRVGEHVLPEGWKLVAAGNRVEDGASVSAMPSPVANRLLHIKVEPSFEEWKIWALNSGIFPEQIISFLNFKPQLLMQPSRTVMAWPSPRSWRNAADMFNIGEEIISAVGEGPDAEFRAFVKIYSKLPDIDTILRGQGNSIPMPNDPSVLYAMMGSFYSRAKTVQEIVNATTWMLDKKISEDFFACYMYDAVVIIQKNDWTGGFIKSMKTNPSYTKIVQFLKEALR